MRSQRPRVHRTGTGPRGDCSAAGSMRGGERGAEHRAEPSRAQSRGRGLSARSRYKGSRLTHTKDRRPQWGLQGPLPEGTGYRVQGLQGPLRRSLRR